MSIAEHLGRAIEKHKTKHEAKRKSEPKSKIHSMEIEPAENEGYIVTHRMEQPEGRMVGGYKEPEKHAIKNHRDLMKHVKEHMCPDASDVEESAEEK